MFAWAVKKGVFIFPEQIEVCRLMVNLKKKRPLFYFFFYGYFNFFYYFNYKYNLI